MKASSNVDLVKLITQDKINPAVISFVSPNNKFMIVTAKAEIAEKIHNCLFSHRIFVSCTQCSEDRYFFNLQHAFFSQSPLPSKEKNQYTSFNNGNPKQFPWEALILKTPKNWKDG